MSNRKFTVQITLVDNKVINVPDLSQTELTSVQERIWRQGWRVIVEKGKWELISPFVMKRVFFIEQIEKKESAGQ